MMVSRSQKLICEFFAKLDKATEMRLDFVAVPKNYLKIIARVLKTNELIELESCDRFAIIYMLDAEVITEKNFSTQNQIVLR